MTVIIYITMSGFANPEVFCEDAIKGMEWPDEYKHGRLGGEHVILNKRKVKWTYNTGTMPYS